MTLSAHSVALQGIGYGALAIALQGFVAEQAAAPPPPAPISSGGFRAPAPHRPVIRAKQRDDEEILLLIATALQVLDI